MIAALKQYGTNYARRTVRRQLINYAIGGALVITGGAYYLDHRQAVSGRRVERAGAGARRASSARRSRRGDARAGARAGARRRSHRRRRRLARRSRRRASTSTRRSAPRRRRSPPRTRSSPRRRGRSVAAAAAGADLRSWQRPERRAAGARGRAVARSLDGNRPVTRSRAKSTATTASADAIRSTR